MLDALTNYVCDIAAGVTMHWMRFNQTSRIGVVAASLAAMTCLAQVSTPPAAAPASQPPRTGQGGGRGFGPAIGVPVLGMPGVHDPSTVVHFHGKYYVYTTGRGASFLSSPDGEIWTREGNSFDKIPDEVHALSPKNDGAGVWAPDIVRVDGKFYLYYAVSAWMSFQSAVAVMSNTMLDPKDPAYKWVDGGVVASSDGVEDLNAIDPGVIHAPDGTLWLCYGSYHGTIDLVQLNPKTGQRIAPKSPVTIIANQSEASDIIYHDGYYYLFVNHGSCCKGKDSEYNIRVGRSKIVTGPYQDKHGDRMTSGGGSLFLAAHDHRIGPGHFGRLLDYDASPDGSEGGPERFSIHYEADMTRGGRSVLDIRPLLWSTDNWPVAGDNLPDAAYEITSRQTENTLEEHLPMPPAATAAPGTAATTPPPSTTPPAPLGPPALHLSRYLTLDNQKWKIASAGAGFYKIVTAGTGDALGAVEGAAALAAFTGADTQLWRLEQFPDGGYRIRNKATGLYLTAAGASGATLSPFVRDDLHLWSIGTP
jgi:arabinan endo-1,5-alpha-L-arabinosidase